MTSRLRNYQHHNFFRINAIGQWIFFACLAPLYLGLERDRIGWQDAALYVLMTLLVVLFFYVAALLAAFQFGRRSAIVVQTFVWMFLIVDAVLVKTLHIHLDSPTVLGSLFISDFNFGVHIPTHLVFAAIFALVSLVVVQTYLIRRAFAPRFLKWMFETRRLVLYSIIAVAGLYVFEEVADFATAPSGAVPIYQSAIRLIHGFPVVRLKLDTNREMNLKMKSTPGILMILVESFRWDLIDPVITPNLYKLSQQKNCTVPVKSYAGGHLTSIGAFAFLYGSEGYLARPFFSARRNSPALRLLRENGYKIYGSDASGLMSYNPKVLQQSQFDKYERFNEKHRAENDVRAVEALKNWTAQTTKPQFSFLFLYATHDSYFSPKDWPAPKVPEADKGDYTEQFALYRKAASFVDAQAGDAIAAFQAAHPTGDSIIVFAGDHGEEFGEHGGWGHAQVGFSDERTRVPNMVCFPKSEAVSRAPVALSTNSDIFPTIFQWSGISEEELQPFFSGRGFWSESPREFAILTGVYFPTNGRDLAVTSGALKIKLNFAGSGPATSDVIRIVDGNDKPLREPASMDDATKKLLQAADKEFHKYLEVEGTVAGYAETSDRFLQH